MPTNLYCFQELIFEGKSMLDPLSLMDHKNIRGKQSIIVTVKEVEPDSASDSEEDERVFKETDEVKEEAL